MKLDKANKRDKANKKARHGQRTGSRSVFLIVEVKVKRAKKAKLPIDKTGKK